MGSKTDNPTNAEEVAVLFDYDNPEWYRQLLAHFRYSFDRRNYPLVADIVAGFLNDRLQIFEFSPSPDDETFRDDIRSLREDGFCRLGRVLDDAAIDAVHAATRDCDLTDQWNEYTGRFTRDEVPAEVTLAELDRKTVVSAPGLAEVANDPRVLARVAAFLGAPPTIQHCIMWWSFTHNSDPLRAQLFHEDRACYRFLKLFVYLTDVTPDAGPHVYVRGSASLKLREERIAETEGRKAGTGQVARKMLSNVRATDRDIETLFGPDRIETLAGAAGEAFLVDTSGYHKGQVPETYDRLVYQALYTMLPTIRDAVNPVASPGYFERLLESSSSFSEATLRYVNRLVVQDP